MPGAGQSQASQSQASQSQASLIAAQFGAQAAAYLTSTVHAEGEDLRQLATIAQAMNRPAVLDLGCGGGHVSYAVAPHAASVVACDLSAQMLAVVAASAADRGLANIVTRQGVAEQLPFADASFDLVLSRFSAHHWLAFEQGLREVARVLRPGGRAAFVDVVAPADALSDTWLQAIELLRDPSHVRDYSVGEWVAATASAGLAVTAITPRRLRMDYPTWIARMQTPAVQAQAIRALQAVMAAEVKQHFAVEPDGSFTIDAITLELRR
jgi:ubiquinone/menaquinone biosynthesis C-methylase UbiE